MANLLYSAKETADISSLINECKVLGIPIIPPDINKCEERFIPTKEGTIKYGFEKIKNVGKTSNIIISERINNGEYTSIQDFIDRILKFDTKGLNKRVVESLIYTGAFDNISNGMTKNQMIEGLESYISDKKDLVNILKENIKYKSEINNIYKDINIIEEDLSEDFIKDFQNLIKKIETAKTEKTKTAVINKIQEYSIFSDITLYGDYINQYIDCVSSSPDVLDLYKEVYDKLKEIPRLQKLIYSRQDKVNNMKEKDYFSFLPEKNKNDLLTKEMLLLGYYYSGHPLDVYKSIIENEKTNFICDIDESYEKQYVRIIGRITNFKKIYRNSDNAEMCSFMLEDATGIIDTITFTKQYQRLKHFFTVDNPDILNDKIVMVEAQVIGKNMNNDDELEIQLSIENITEISQEIMYVKVKKEQINDVKEFAKECSGSSSVYIFNTDDNRLYKLNDVFVDTVLFKKELELLNLEYVIK